MTEPSAKRSAGRAPSLAGIVIADDLTGACDSALAISKTGLSVSVVQPAADMRSLAVDLEGAVSGTSDVQVVVVNSCSRGDADGNSRKAKTFYSGMEQFLGRCGAVPANLKVDSSLRGNVGMDIAMAMKQLGKKHCILAPALPEAGRITVGAVHLLNGVPVATALKANSLPTQCRDGSAAGNGTGGNGGETLPTCSSILSLLSKQQAFQQVALNTVNIDVVENGTEAIAAALRDCYAMSEQTVTVVDATTQTHLSDLAGAINDDMQNETPLLAGSAGLAAELSKAWGVQPLDGANTEQASPCHGGTVVYMIGSNSATCSTQLKRLREAVPALVELDVSSGNDATLPESCLAGSPSAVLLTSQADAAVQDTIPQLCTVAVKLFKKIGAQLAGVVVSGGYTLNQLLTGLEGGQSSVQLSVLQEVDSCTPMLQVKGGALDQLRIVSKGGHLGGEDVFVRAWKQLAGQEDKPRTTISCHSAVPILAITMGDVAGIGPEIIAKALRLPETWHICKPVVLGSHDALLAANKVVKSRVTPLLVDSIDDINWESVCSMLAVDSDGFLTGKVPVLSHAQCDYGKITLGQVSPHAGSCAAQWVIQAVKLCMDGKADAIVTAPLNKEAMNAGGHHYAGHTELLAKFSGARTSRLMLASDKLKVVHATGHCSLADVSSKLTVDRLAETIVMSGEFLRNQGLEQPRIAIAGLNPHAGDGGLFGNEETTVLGPAIERCRSDGWTVSDPIPSDTLFCRALKGEFDIVVAMYHDQGHIPAKLVDFGSTVNVTLGLPIIRTSVDHGTAFDIAGKGVADEANLMHAIRLGASMAASRKA